MPQIVDTIGAANPPHIDITSPGVGTTVLWVALAISAALVVGLVLARKEVRILDVFVIAPLFVIIGACTPVGQLLAHILGRMTIG